MHLLAVLGGLAVSIVWFPDAVSDGGRRVALVLWALCLLAVLVVAAFEAALRRRETRLLVANREADDEPT